MSLPNIFPTSPFSDQTGNMEGQEGRVQTYLQALTGGGRDQIEPVAERPPSSVPTTIPSPLITTSSSEVTRGRGRSVSFSLGPSLSVQSPVRGREHASEAGSPTLEQVLLMSRQSQNSADAGYGSFSFSSPRPESSQAAQASPEETHPTESPKQAARPTLADVVGIDMAVAQAVSNLQALQQQQATMWRAQYPAPTSLGPGSLQPPNRGSQVSANTMLSSILASVSQPPMDQSAQQPRDPLALERAARLYRSAASVYEASCTWSGQLPPRSSTAGPNSSYSTKIFLGGVPWDISEQTLVQAFAEFGEVRVEWPGRDYTAPPRGYLYLVFQEEGDITDLLAKCSQDYSSRDSYYYRISSRRMRSKEVQIIPWVIADSNYVRCASPRLDPQKTVFVGALHGMMTAQGLAVVFNDLFGGVVYSGLDTDKHKYPIGSGRVTFNNSRSYMKAVAAAFIEIKTPRFCKKVQVDPYLEDTICSLCSMKQGPYFCRDLSCFNYFCHGCWDLHHTNTRHHKPLMRNIRGLTRARTSQAALHQQEFNHVNGGRFRADPVRDLVSQFGETFGLQGGGGN